MKLYDCRTAPSPRRVRIFAAEKGIELELITVDLAKGEQFSEAYRRLNPDCVVPTLELEDGSHISEVVAICQYLEEIHPKPALFGEDVKDRARVAMWNIKAEQQGLWAVADAFRNSVKGLQGRALPGPDAFDQIPELAARGRERTEIFFRRLDQELSGRPFIAGERFSIADITAMVALEFAKRLKIPLPPSESNLGQWHLRVAKRPSAHA